MTEVLMLFTLTLAAPIRYFVRTSPLWVSTLGRKAAPCVRPLHFMAGGINVSDLF